MQKKYKYTSLLFSLFLVLAVALSLTAAQVVHAALQAPSGSQYKPSKDGKQATVSVWITYYGYDDNSNSATIAYPKSGNPTLHNVATEGKGTYTDPVTFAAPDKNLDLFPIGSIMYVPFLHKYFIMEDQCGDSDPTGCAQDPHADLFMGPSSPSTWHPLRDCENNSKQGFLPVVINPASNFAVDQTLMFQNDTCTIHDKYSNQVTTTSGNPPPSDGIPNPQGKGQVNPNPPPVNLDLTPPNNQNVACAASNKTGAPAWTGSVDGTDWQKSWGVKANDPRTIGATNLAPVSDPGGQLSSKALQVSYPTGGTAPQNAEGKGITYGSQFLATLNSKSYDCLYLSYYVLFPQGFNFANGGKLPGLYGGDTVYGKAPPDGSNGFSVRLMWDRSGGGGVCAYLPEGSALQGAKYDFDRNETSIGLGSWNFAADGQWHHVEMLVKLNANTANQLPDGGIQVWYDNKTVLTATGVKFRTPGTSKLKIDGLFFSTFFNSLPKGSTLTLPTNAQVDFTDFAVGESLIAKDSHLKPPTNSQDPTQNPPPQQQPPVTTQTNSPAPGTGTGQYDLTLTLTPSTQTSTTGTQTYQIQVSNISGSVTQTIILEIAIVGNESPLQLTASDSTSSWTLERNSKNKAPRLWAIYRGTNPGYPISANTVLPPITITLTGKFSTKADLTAWVDVSGDSGQGDLGSNMLTHPLVTPK